ncbi:MAG: helix-turn-helix transcriptional regulator [Deltaproteobacteria bacterium]|nr:helix-turn-helix transcriptional regulator [Deltaproteobacteria bacterium]
MIDPLKMLLESRQALGMSQLDLCHQAGVSLATVQNIEAGRANPSLSTLERILDALGLWFQVGYAGTDWDALADHGLPLASGSENPRHPTPEGLRHHLTRAVVEIEARGWPKNRDRKTEALEAMLLALRSAYPTTFQSWFGRSKVVNRLVPDNPSGRVIRLKRIAVRALSEYL